MSKKRRPRGIENNLLAQLKTRHRLSEKEENVLVWIIGYLNGQIDDLDTEQRIASALGDYLRGVRSK